MKLPIFNIAVIASSLFFGLASTCQKREQPLPNTVVVGGGTAANNLNAGVTALGGKQDAAEEKLKDQLSKIGAEIIASKSAAESITSVEDAHPKKAIQDSLTQAKTELGDTVIKPEDANKAMDRVLLNLQGKYEEASRAYADATTQAIAAKAERDAAIKARDDSLSQVMHLVDEHKKELEKNRAAAQDMADKFTRQINSERTRHQGEIDQLRDAERKRMLSYLSWALLGLGVVLTLVAVATMYLSKGMEWQRAAIAGGGASACYTMYWTMNQPWFKYVVLTCIGGFVAAVIWWLYTEHASAKAKQLLIKARSETEDEVVALSEREQLLRSTAIKIVSKLDAIKNKPMNSDEWKLWLENLRGDMDVDERKVVHALRFEQSTGLPVTPTS